MDVISTGLKHFQLLGRALCHYITSRRITQKKNYELFRLQTTVQDKIAAISTLTLSKYHYKKNSIQGITIDRCYRHQVHDLV